MKVAKRKKLEAAGFHVGDFEDFLGLSPEEKEMVDLRLKVSRLVRQLREQQHMSQKELAIRIESNQSRVARLESGSGDVSHDLMFRGFFAVGGKLIDVLGEPKIKPASPRGRTRSPGTGARCQVKGVRNGKE